MGFGGSVSLILDFLYFLELISWGGPLGICLFIELPQVNLVSNEAAKSLAL